MAVKPLSTVRAEIISTIYTNTSKAVTGDLLQARLLDLLDSLTERGNQQKLDYFAHCVAGADGGWNTVGVREDIDGRFGIRSAQISSVTSIATQAMNTIGAAVKLGQREFRLETEVAPYLALTNGTEQGTLFAGVADQVGYLMTSFVGVRSVNGGNWMLVASNSGVESVYDLGITPAVGMYRRLGVAAAADGLSVQAIVDGALVGSPISTSLPVGVWLSPCVGIHRAQAAAYTTTRGISVDWLHFYEP